MQDRNTDELAAIWANARDELRGRVSESAFESWLEPLRPVGVQGSRLYVDGPDRVRGWFERRYRSLATAAVMRCAPGIDEIVFAEPGGTGDTAAECAIPAALGRDLDFDRFVIGPGNRFAHASALAVAELPGEAYNPLFLYGDPGLGKTHLLVSIANYLSRRRPDLNVTYTTAERFTSDFVSSLRGKGGNPGAFKASYRNVGALLIDDVQFLENKPRTEDEFFHTFNELYAAGAQIVLSSDRPPEAMERLTSRLRDRFAWGLTVRVSEPDVATREALLRRLAAERGMPIPDGDSLRQIALSAPANLRQLEGALTRVSAYCSLLGREPSGELVRDALSGPGDRRGEAPVLPHGAEEPGLEEIKVTVCEILRVPRAGLTSPKRTPNLVRARQLAMYVARNSTSHSLAQISRAFERDHSTVLHAIRTVERRLEPGSDIHRALEAVHQRLHIESGPS